MNFNKIFFCLSFITVILFSCGDKCDDILCASYQTCEDGNCIGEVCDTITCQNLGTCEAGICDCPEEFFGIFCQNQVWHFSPDNYTNETVQAAMINMVDGDTIKFAAGTFIFNSTLSVDDKNDVVIIGAGMNETIFDFTNQTAGAEGLKITANNTIIANFTVKNTVGDAIKVKDSDGFSFINVATIWDGVANEENGAYGLYPVSSKNILIDGCLAKGASDAGLYVGQCENVIVKNCTADNNVAGIEIENTINADVFDNTAINNTGGILVFDLPDLPAGQGKNCRIFNNTIENNNYRNFAPEGNIVAAVPSGTGIMILASEKVEIFNNTITENNVMSIGLINYLVIEELLGQSWNDENYIPNPRSVWIHDNTITRSNNCPPYDELNSVGLILNNVFPNCDYQEILWDGIPVETTTENQNCIENSGEVADLDLENFPLNEEQLSVTLFNCTGVSLPEVTINAPILE